MADNQYIYAVARIRSLELSLLDKTFFDQLLACKSFEDCLRLLSDKGWGRNGDLTAEQLLESEREKIWDTIKELVKDTSVFDTFLYGNDFHNLKAAIKQVYMNEEVPGIFISRGTIAPESILKAVMEHDFSTLPKRMSACAEEAYQVQFHTGDSQLCDVIIDKAALESIYQSGKTSGNDLLNEYAELKVASADINIAIRSYKTGKKREFLERAIADCTSLDRKKLIEAAQSGEEEIYDYLSNTAYSDAVQAIKESLSSFDRWCDNLIIRHIKPQKYNSFTLSPIAAYILARENEIKSVRILLSGKLNDLPEESIRERLREMYV
ncbi:V-type ATP synthase subunit C [Anaerocolumna sedimenticola]|uniref:V-type ATP synthase subunit C n=1 Tax=Anaerocolumna sedimenticola TaxID=2696063 RepID=A0A6P1TPD4_9FIRM|nr:V-type ATPase subunit [Anaerocolumna sedimenticola]QHQ61741.1 V-type ATP synthase subunit C [Anaerocolumna sedimenticola]